MILEIPSPIEYVFLPDPLPPTTEKTYEMTRSSPQKLPGFCPLGSVARIDVSFVFLSERENTSLPFATEKGFYSGKSI